MITLGKKVSSCIAVAIAWVAGSLCFQLISLGILFVSQRWRGSDSEQKEKAAEMLLAAAMPLIICLGGTLAIWLMRKFKGWPKLPLPALFLRALVFSVFSLPLLLTNNILWVVGVADVLAIVGVITLTWREAARHELGTHVFPGATRTEK